MKSLTTKSRPVVQAIRTAGTALSLQDSERDHPPDWVGSHLLKFGLSVFESGNQLSPSAKKLERLTQKMRLDSMFAGAQEARPGRNRPISWRIRSGTTEEQGAHARVRVRRVLATAATSDRLPNVLQDRVATRKGIAKIFARCQLTGFISFGQHSAQKPEKQRRHIGALPSKDDNAAIARTRAWVGGKPCPN